MSEARLSAVELGFLEDTLELVLEELQGVVEATDYIMTTGAKEEVEDALLMIELKQKFLEPDMYEPLEPLDFAEEDRRDSSEPPWEEFK